MADLDKIMRALRNAHAAGDTEAAKRLAKMARDAKMGVSSVTQDQKDRIAAAKAGTLEISPERLAEQKKFDDAGMKDLVASTYQPGRLASFAAGAAQGGTFGFADEIVAGLHALSPNDTYDAALQRTRGLLDASRRDHPGFAYGGEVAGAVVAPAAAWKGGATLAGQAGRAAATGAGQGFLYGIGAGEGGAVNRLAGGLATGVAGGVIGAALPFASAGAKAFAEKRMLRRAADAVSKSAPSMDDLRAAAGRLYDQADNAAHLDRSAFSTAAQSAISAAERKGLDADLTPGAAKLVDRMTDAATDPNPKIGFRELDILHRKAAVPAGNVSNRTEQAIGASLGESIDDFVRSVDPVLGGKVADARQLWGQLRRSEMIEKAIAKAKDAASGFENGLRVEFRAILRDPKKLRGFTTAEVNAMRQVVQGTPMGNLLRQIGRMGIGLSGQSNGLGAMISGIGGTAIGGPGMGVALPAIGTAAKYGAERIAARSAERARGLAAAGGVKSVPKLTAEQLSRIDSILRGLSRSAATSAAEYLPAPARR